MQIRNKLDLLAFESLPGILILIDCWDKIEDQNTIQNIFNFCQTDPGLETAVLATYISDNGEQILKEDPWYTNAKSLFYDTARWEPLRDLWLSTSFVDPTPEFKFKTSSMILDISKLGLERCFLAWHYSQLMYYLRYINPHLKKIIMAGFAWQNCIKWRTLGYRDICRLIQYGFLDSETMVVSHKNLVGNMIDHVYTLEPPWVDIGYGYCKVDMALFVDLDKQIFDNN